MKYMSTARSQVGGIGNLKKGFMSFNMSFVLMFDALNTLSL